MTSGAETVRVRQPASSGFAVREQRIWPWQNGNVRVLETNASGFDSYITPQFLSQNCIKLFWKCAGWAPLCKKCR